MQREMVAGVIPRAGSAYTQQTGRGVGGASDIAHHFACEIGYGGEDAVSD